ncbi:MAG: carboxypeptidase-like regulatory domain-containing protein [Planctomycetota bacterium]|nr:carboxypeptidase regulatory-like domain-containing protein [Planctomycetaceae bacterium]MDQ3331584.1 carboxypeptidase-like regulatory domain-containing protein [Planctomycetota bacterium]
MTLTRRIGCLLLLSLAGCGSDGPELSEVTGTVTLDGKPLQGAILTFIPEAPGASTSYGITDAEGNYSLMYSRDKSGAMIGTHKVEIATEKLTADDMADGQPVPKYVPIPKKYKEPGALTADVKSGDNDIDFELTST